MLCPRLSLGIAQTIFYLPVLILAIVLFVRNFRYHPRMAWWPFIPLSLLRLAGGIIIIVLETQQQRQQQDGFGLIVAAIVLLNVGVVPLIVATLGQMRIVLIDNFRDNPRTNTIARALRFTFVIAIVLLSAGGGLSATSRTIARALSLAGYGVFAAELAILIAIEVYYFVRRHELYPSSRRVRTIVVSISAARN